MEMDCILKETFGEGTVEKVAGVKNSIPQG